MKKFIILLLITFCGCQSQEEKEKAITSSAIIYASFDLFHERQQLFIDKLTNALLQVKEDNNATIDTEELRTLLDSAKEDCHNRLAILKTVDEIDDGINYKQKAINYASLFSSAYDNEFMQAVEILESDADHKLERISRDVTDKMEEIKAAEVIFVEASEEAKEKYNLHYAVQE